MNNEYEKQKPATQLTANILHMTATVRFMCRYNPVPFICIPSCSKLITAVAKMGKT